MATKYVFLSGKCKWAKLRKPDRFGNWSIQLYPDSESMARFHTLNLKNEVKKDEDGEYVLLRRNPSKLMRGKVVEFTQPEVLDSEGKPTDALIGNGSDVTVKLSVYTGESPRGKYVGSRIEAVRIDNLIPYVPSTREVDQPQEFENRGEPENLPF